MGFFNNFFEKEVILIGLASFFIHIDRPILSIGPFVYLCLKGSKEYTTAFILAIVWSSYLILLSFPLKFAIGKWYLLFVSTPIAVIKASQFKNAKNNILFLEAEYYVWDYPLLLCSRIALYLEKMIKFFYPSLTSVSSLRIFKPFYSEINNLEDILSIKDEKEWKHLDLVVGSIPLMNSDVDLMAEKGVTVVINMCREFPGLVDRYKKYGIVQLHLPTPDLSEPDLKDLVRGVDFLKRHAEVCKAENRKGKVFIHCKAGRGRASIMALAWLICNGTNPYIGMKHLKLHRSVAVNVSRTKVILALEQVVRQRFRDDMTKNTKTNTNSKKNNDNNDKTPTK